MVRILHVLAAELPSSTIRQIGLLCEGLLQRGFENCICSFESNNQSRRPLALLGECEGMSFCSYRSRRDPTLLYRFGQKLRQLRPDLIHYWGANTDAMVLLTNRLYGQRPMVVSTDAIGHGSWLTGSVRFVVSNEQAKLHLHRSGIATNRIDILPPGIMLGEANSIRSLHAELGISRDVKFVAAMGDLLAKHRFKDVIWTLDLLRVIHPDVHLVIFGEGRERFQLKHIQNHIVSSDSVHFWGGELEIQDLMKQCFCFWHASPTDNSAICQAMAAGLPVVAVQGQGTEAARREVIVREGSTGYLVPLGDCAEIARKTNLLLKDPDKVTELRQAGRQFIREQYGPDSMVRAFVDVYEQAMKRPAVAA